MMNIAEKRQHCMEEVIREARDLCQAWPKKIKPEDSYTVYYDGVMTLNETFSPHHSGLAAALAELDRWD